MEPFPRMNRESLLRGRGRILTNIDCLYVRSLKFRIYPAIET